MEGFTVVIVVEIVIVVPPIAVFIIVDKEPRVEAIVDLTVTV